MTLAVIGDTTKHFENVDEMLVKFDPVNRPGIVEALELLEPTAREDVETFLRAKARQVVTVCEALRAADREMAAHGISVNNLEIATSSDALHELLTDHGHLPGYPSLEVLTQIFGFDHDEAPWEKAILGIQDDIVRHYLRREEQA